jgi:hypothetical protein
MTICKVRGHKWRSVRYPTSEEDRPGRMEFRRCQRCAKERHGDLSKSYTPPVL